MASPPGSPEDDSLLAEGLHGVSLDGAAPSGALSPEGDGLEGRRWGEADALSKSFTLARRAEPMWLPRVECGAPEEPGVEYASVDDFRDPAVIYKGRQSEVAVTTCNATGNQVVLKSYVKEKMRQRHYKNVQREIEILRMMTCEGCCAPSWGV
ncbi:unnamed protein product [Ostreobium quekettii]|uniref:Uncharacterized protein n=1 Tax=Ostreobium quekettii TaxID=121088 RepID=A0A8S1J0R2_9CHLO|nr:unnamed protein product [Ostreobium quekettii]|eukprot:evm.model.scf_74.7 EVM.evm.TU.scf_74.7   scf_74:55572-57808(-)